MKQISYLIVLFLCTSIAGSFEVTYQEYYQQHWQTWKSFYGKTYGSETEEEERFAVWNDNLRLIQKHNSKGKSYSLAMNQFGDLTAEEFRFLVSRSLFTASNEKEHYGLSFLPSSAALPPFVDWRTKGYVTPVKNQGELGSSWAFSTTGSLEGQHFKKTGKLVSLSEQNLEDCSGCVNLITAIDCGFEYVKNNGGIDTENGYPHPCNKSCCFDKSKVGATCTGYVDITPRSELALQSAVATVGPISVGIDASHQSFQFYASGVYDEPSCSSSQLDHAVLVVGYGTYEGKDYWLVKNSWGTHWGMEGYIMMSRNKDNQCGIATSASYPLV